MASGTAQVKIQNFGRFLSGMVMPNIAAFIAWGLITAFFIPTGWTPNETLSKLVGPMIVYLLPLLLGYTGGGLVGGRRGSVVGAIMTMGVIIGTDVPMFLGAMIAGPIGGWVIKKIDEVIQPRIKAGFEMLINNFSAGITAMILAILAFFIIGPSAQWITTILGDGVGFLVDKNLLPLTSLLVEPAKVLFLNNAINHGVFTPLGTEQVADIGKSIFFLIEANPGPGLGLLLAYWFCGSGMAKQSAPGAIIIHFFGGIHEIYFPYVLMRPIMILAMWAGGIVNVTTLLILRGGLVGPASPGSIIAALAVTARGAHFATIMSVILSCAASFVVAFLILRATPSTADDDLESAQLKQRQLKYREEGGKVPLAKVSKICISCDGGMGSSAMGATILRNKVKDAGLSVNVEHVAIAELPSNVDVVFTQESLRASVEAKVPTAHIYAISNFMDQSIYDDFVAALKEAKK